MNSRSSSSQIKNQAFRVQINARSVSRSRGRTLETTPTRSRSTKLKIMFKRGKSELIQGSCKNKSREFFQRRATLQYATFSTLASIVIQEFKIKQEKNIKGPATSETNQDVLSGFYQFSKNCSTVSTSDSCTGKKHIFIMKKRDPAMKKKAATTGCLSITKEENENGVSTPKYFKFREVTKENMDSRIMPFMKESVSNLKQIHMDQYLTQPKIPTKVSTEDKPVLALDLDETLVHCCNFDQSPTRSQTTLTYVSASAGALVTVYLNVRPYAEEFLKRTSQRFKLVVYTASESDYASAVCRFLDPSGQLISAIYSRGSCLRTEKGFLVKDLRVISGDDTSNIFLVDNSTYCFAAQINNGIPILPYCNEKRDSELLKLASFLDYFSNQVEKKKFLKSYFGMSKLFKVKSSEDIFVYLRSIGQI